MSTPRVRFAPSPTGYLHVGGARTALFNWLYARGRGGSFVLRIEDTDAERSSWPMVAGIVEGLRWLGLDWDEGPDIGGPHTPYLQSERLDTYHTMAARLVESGHAYYCYCSPETLAAKRHAAEQAGEGWRYDRTCCHLTPEAIAGFEAAGAPRAVRFKVPGGVSRVEDLVHGAIEFERANIEDFVVLRSDGQPTYHLSVVVDDIEMDITHIVRGDDHISNTPKQMLLYEAFGARMPAFAHVPLILGRDKKRLSKRHGATSVIEYRRLGYIPEAMVNFLALLGWSPGTDQEVFTRDELIASFSLDAISGGNAVFNPEKLDWFNAQHIARLSASDLGERVRPALEDAGLWDVDLNGARQSWFFRLLDLFRPRVRRLSDYVDALRPFLSDTVEYDQDAVRKHLTVPDLESHVAALAARFLRTEPFDELTLERELRHVAESRGITAGTLIHATRVALTGKAVSPGLFEIIALAGRDATLARLEQLGRFLQTRKI